MAGMALSARQGVVSLRREVVAPLVAPCGGTVVREGWKGGSEKAVGGRGQLDRAPLTANCRRSELGPI